MFSFSIMLINSSNSVMRGQLNRCQLVLIFIIIVVVMINVVLMMLVVMWLVIFCRFFINCDFFSLVIFICRWFLVSSVMMFDSLCGLLCSSCCSFIVLLVILVVDRDFFRCVCIMCCSWCLMMWCVFSFGVSSWYMVFRLSRVLFSRFSFGGVCRLQVVVMCIMFSIMWFLEKLLLVVQCVISWLVLCRQCFLLKVFSCVLMLIRLLVIFLSWLLMVVNRIFSSCLCRCGGMCVIMFRLKIVSWLLGIICRLFGCGLVWILLCMKIWFRQSWISVVVSGFMFCLVWCMLEIVFMCMLVVSFMVSMCWLLQFQIGCGIYRWWNGCRCCLKWVRFLVLVWQFSFCIRVFVNLLSQLCRCMWWFIWVR